MDRFAVVFKILPLLLLLLLTSGCAKDPCWKPDFKEYDKQYPPKKEKKPGDEAKVYPAISFI